MAVVSVDSIDHTSLEVVCTARHMPSISCFTSQRGALRHQHAAPAHAAIALTEARVSPFLVSTYEIVQMQPSQPRQSDPQSERVTHTDRAYCMRPPVA